MAKMVHQEQPLTDNEFQEFERMFVRSAPNALKSYYMSNNGGHTSEEDAEAGKFGLPVGGFHSIKYGKLTIEELVDDLGDITPLEFGAWNKFAFIPFAHDEGSNIIFVSLRDNNYGSVYIFDPNVGNIAMVAPSYEAFLVRLFKKE